jgi:hypothetical protein
VAASPTSAGRLETLDRFVSPLLSLIGGTCSGLWLNKLGCCSLESISFHISLNIIFHFMFYPFRKPNEDSAKSKPYYFTGATRSYSYTTATILNFQALGLQGNKRKIRSLRKGLATRAGRRQRSGWQKRSAKWTHDPAGARKCLQPDARACGKIGRKISD